MIKERMASYELDSIGQQVDKDLSPYDIEFSSHFFDRLNDPRNGKEITDDELLSFFQRLAKHKDKLISFLSKYGEIVASDRMSKLNIPFVKQANDIIAKTIMRKPDFQTSNPKLVFESKNSESKQEINIMENKNTELAGKIAKQIEKMTGKKVVLEKWAEPAKIADSKKGMFKGKSLSDLRAELKKIKDKEKRTAADTSKMKELNFAIRAKSKWGKVKAESTLAESKKEQAIKILTKQIEEATGKKVKFKEAEEISNNTIGELTVGEIIPPASAKIIRDYVDITLNEINAKVMELSEIKKDIGVKGKATGEDWNQKTQDVQFRIKQLERVARFVNNSLIAGKFDKNILDKVIALTADSDTAAVSAPAITPPMPEAPIDTTGADAIPVM